MMNLKESLKIMWTIIKVDSKKLLLLKSDLKKELVNNYQYIIQKFY